MHEIHLRLISLPNWHYPFLPCLHLVLCLLLVPFHQLVLREFRQSQILQKRKKMKKKYRSTWGSVMESLFVRRSLLLVWTVNKIILFWLSTCAFDKHFLLLTCLNAMWAGRVNRTNLNVEFRHVLFIRLRDVTTWRQRSQLVIGYNEHISLRLYVSN